MVPKAPRENITGKTRDVGYQVGARRTMPVGLKQAWRLITSPDAVKIWLGENPDLRFIKGAVYHLPDGTSGEVRVFKPDSHMRITWQPRDWQKPSTIQIRVIPNGDKTVFAFHQENLPGPDERQQRLVFFKNVLDRLEQLIRSG
jgi:uncharacterized protein YndB with AHSA1/START domain